MWGAPTSELVLHVQCPRSVSSQASPEGNLALASLIHVGSTIAIKIAMVPYYKGTPPSQPSNMLRPRGFTDGVHLLKDQTALLVGC